MNSNPLRYMLSGFDTWLFVVVLLIIGICDECYLLPRNSYVTTNAFIVVRHHATLRWTLKRASRMNSEMEEGLSSSSTSLPQQEKSTKRKPRPSPTGFSYVEDGVYTNIEEEIEAMGGDPSFLIESAFSPSASTNSTNTVLTSSDASPVVAWEWDGVEENDAYFDE